jgi:hypothetical protein
MRRKALHYKAWLSKCATSIEGVFSRVNFAVSPKRTLIVKVFIKCRGNIKDVEKELGISYPTVRGKLDTVIRGLGFEVTVKEAAQEREMKDAARGKILDQLSKGEISEKEATERIKTL